tara:strand:+ start:1633 stop:2124 length:492 start_codon:yes stop_codon:yes gene_type:complete
MTAEALLSIGVYGYSEEGFFDALQRARVDCFCDVRARRGLRGSQYAFANSQRLQARLRIIGIKYVHIKELSPSKQVREAQKQIDAQQGVLKRSREELGDQFKLFYAKEALEDLDASRLLNIVLAGSSRPVFFCVEKSPKACHRSLVTEELSRQTGLPVEHIIP